MSVLVLFCRGKYRFHKNATALTSSPSQSPLNAFRRVAFFFFFFFNLTPKCCLLLQPPLLLRPPPQTHTRAHPIATHLGAQVRLVRQNAFKRNLQTWSRSCTRLDSQNIQYFLFPFFFFFLRATCSYRFFGSKHLMSNQSLNISHLTCIK